MYFAGTIVGLVGLFYLVATSWGDYYIYGGFYPYSPNYSPKARKITYVFASLAFAPLSICILVYGGYVATFFAGKGFRWAWNYLRYFTYYDDERKKVPINWDPPDLLEHAVRNSVLGILFFGLFGAFYCDWILAALTNNWSGAPSNDIAALYWIYFVAKRFPMLSF